MSLNGGVLCLSRSEDSLSDEFYERVSSLKLSSSTDKLSSSSDKIKSYLHPQIEKINIEENEPRKKSRKQLSASAKDTIRTINTNFLTISTEFDPRSNININTLEIKINSTSFDPRDKIAVPNIKTLQNGNLENDSYTIANDEKNVGFNRYTDVIPKDNLIYAPTTYQVKDNLIQLTPYYLNAVKIPIEVEGKRLAYIATQAPLECTFNEFWKAIIIGKSDTIINLAMPIEKNKLKADDYWSDTYWDKKQTFEVFDENKSLGSIMKKGRDEPIGQTKNNSNERIVKCTFEFTPTDDSETRTITLFHYENWPDFGIPEDMELFETLISLIDASEKEKKGPPFIHCSAGIGRTGTCIVTHLEIERMKQQSNKGMMPNVDPIKTIEILRTFRNGMVQTQQQLDIIYAAIFRYGEKLEKHIINLIKV